MEWAEGWGTYLVIYYPTRIECRLGPGKSVKEQLGACLIWLGDGEQIKEGVSKRVFRGFQQPFTKRIYRASSAQGDGPESVHQTRKS
jgi:hypothetical protein